MATAYNLPELIAWAEDIRSGAIKMAEDNLKVAEDGFNYGFSADDARVFLAEVIDTLLTVNSAKILIDNRGCFSKHRLDDMLRMEHHNGAISKARAAR